MLPGKADKSYGLHVARLAGVNNWVIDNPPILEKLERTGIRITSYGADGIVSTGHPLFEELQNLMLTN